MKGVLILFSASILIFLAEISGNTVPHGTIIGVLPQHDTRVELVYRYPDRTFKTESTHQSEVVTDGKSTVDPQKYLSIYCKKTCIPYGPLPGHKKEYQEFLNQK